MSSGQSNSSLEGEESILSLEFAWPFAVAAGSAGTLVGLFVGWPAFSAAFAAVGLWTVERRARLQGRHLDTALVSAGWLIAVLFTTGYWGASAMSEAIDKAFPGAVALSELAGSQPFLLTAGAACASLVAAFGARWADGSFAYWVWALVAGYLAIVTSTLAGADASPGNEIWAILRWLPLGPAFAILLGIAVRALRSSGDRRYAWAGLVILVAALAGTVLR